RSSDLFHTEKSLYIYDSNTSQFNKMPGDIRSGTYQRYIADTTYLHNIIADKTMSSLNQFQSGLTLSDAALAHDQHAFTVYIHQNAMDGYTRCKLHTKPADNFSHESRCSSSGHQARHIIFMGQIQHILIRFCHGSKHHAWNLAGNKAFKSFHLLLSFQMQKVGILYITNDLDPFIGKMLQISCKLQSRTVNLRCVNPF